MKEESQTIRTKLAKIRFFSPEGFFVCAAIITVIFVAMEALGLRSSVAVLAGASPGAGAPATLGMACLYLLGYLAFVVLAPIFVMGSIFLLLVNLITGIFRRQQRHF
ncbi:MAG: hypothetical protein JSW66_12845 [Phycisphaerales bacterium]|nr:MAG: hypothetical protein JSW66_12845 [Phycisphaerales bacterium]